MKIQKLYTRMKTGNLTIVCGKVVVCAACDGELRFKSPIGSGRYRFATLPMYPKLELGQTYCCAKCLYESGYVAVLSKQDKFYLSSEAGTKKMSRKPKKMLKNIMRKKFAEFIQSGNCNSL